jgi:hypothetical protein
MKINRKKVVQVEAVAVVITAKVRDAGCYTIIDQEGEVIGEHDGYVPDFFPEEHYGDYLMLQINLDTGQVMNWTAPTPEQVEGLIGDA